MAKKRSNQYTVLGWVIQDPKKFRSYFVAWSIDENGRRPLFSRSIGEYWIFKSKAMAEKHNNIIRGVVRRIEIWG